MVGTVTNELSPQTLRALFSGDVLVVRAPRFWHGGVEANRAFAPYIGAPADSGLTKSGPVQYEFRTKAAYFAAARVATVLDAPLATLRRLFERLCGEAVHTPEEPGHGAYHAGILQRMQGEGMLLHMDYAPVDAPGWCIEQVEAQLACVIHLQVPRTGGITSIYARAYAGHDDDAHRVSNSYHFDDGVLGDARCVRVRADAGDLVLFNSRNFHRVSESGGSRLTFSVFFGRARDGRFWMWS